MLGYRIDLIPPYYDAGSGQHPRPFDLYELREFAASMRRVIELGLPITGAAQPCSAGACLHAAVLLIALLEQFGMCKSRVRGGSGQDGFGARSISGDMRGHYWVEAELASGEIYTVDVTADQFGFDEVVMLDAESAKLRYAAGPQNEVDEAAMELAVELGAGALYAMSRSRWDTSNVLPRRYMKWEGA